MAPATRVLVLAVSATWSGTLAAAEAAALSNQVPQAVCIRQVLQLGIQASAFSSTLSCVTHQLNP